MKTEYEIEQMKAEIQKRISTTSKNSQTVLNEGDKDAFNFYDREYAKLVAQYNILCEVLQ
ncbi:MAG: hypothetical protein RR744_11250 [Cellulosilyticaceae bacterium]